MSPQAFAAPRRSLPSRPLHACLLASLLAVELTFLSSCGAGGTYCEHSGKYGTQCYALDDVRNPPGSRPRTTAQEKTFWNQSPPGQFAFGTAAPAPQPVQTGAAGAGVPMSSPGWRPTLRMPADAGPDSTAAAAPITGTARAPAAAPFARLGAPKQAL